MDVEVGWLVNRMKIQAPKSQGSISFSLFSVPSVPLCFYRRFERMRSPLLKVASGLFLFVFTSFFPLEALSLDRIVLANLAIGDTAQAVAVAKNFVRNSPQNSDHWKWLIKALSAAGAEADLIGCWQQFFDRFPLESCEEEVLETLSWGVISAHAASSLPQQRLMAVAGAFLSQDARAAKFLLGALEDKNTIIRAVSAELSSYMGDAALIEAVCSALAKEKNKKVRIALLGAMGRMSCRQVKNILWEVIQSNVLPLEEKVAAIESFVQIDSSLTVDALQNLSSCNRAALRLLSCEAVVYSMEKEKAKVLFPLLNDSQGVVRAAAWQALALLRIESIPSSFVDGFFFEKHLKDPEPEAAVATAWYLALQRDTRGIEALRSAFINGSFPLKQCALGALNCSGPYGISLVKELFFGSDDLIEKANLALALIGQREEVQEAGKAIAALLEGSKQQLFWQKRAAWQVLAYNNGSKEGEDTVFSKYAIDQLVRLELLAILAAIDHPEAIKSIRYFLKTNQWGISATAASLLLSEGGDEALAIVRELLKDSDCHIRVQAALVLALWGHDERAADCLEESYGGAGREYKEKILEALGSCGTRSCLPFLLRCMQEPFASLRLIAAAAILQVLNR